MWDKWSILYIYSSSVTVVSVSGGMYGLKTYFAP
jgi:hypothetical protein